VIKVANKLINLKVTSVDLVPLGANPDANIKIFKQRKEENKMENKTNENEFTVESITKNMSESLQSIKDDTTLSEQQKIELIHKSLNECVDFIEKSKSDDKDKTKDEPTSKEEKIEKDDKVNQSAEKDSNQSNEVNPEVKKVLDEFAQLRKELEMRDLEVVAKQYEILGKKTDELAPKLYELKKAGGTAYNDYISVLDEMKTVYQTSGIFKEIGSNRQGDNSAEGKLNAAVTEIKKSNPNISTAEAIIKACDNDPELKAMYEAM